MNTSSSSASPLQSFAGLYERTSLSLTIASLSASSDDATRVSLYFIGNLLLVLLGLVYLLANVQNSAPSIIAFLFLVLSSTSSYNVFTYVYYAAVFLQAFEIARKYRPSLSFDTICALFSWIAIFWSFWGTHSAIVTPTAILSAFTVSIGFVSGKLVQLIANGKPSFGGVFTLVLVLVLTVCYIGETVHIDQYLVMLLIPFASRQGFRILRNILQLSFGTKLRGFLFTTLLVFAGMRMHATASSNCFSETARNLVKESMTSFSDYACSSLPPQPSIYENVTGAAIPACPSQPSEEIGWGNLYGSVKVQQVHTGLWSSIQSNFQELEPIYSDERCAYKKSVIISCRTRLDTELQTHLFDIQRPETFVHPTMGAYKLGVMTWAKDIIVAASRNKWDDVRKVTGAWARLLGQEFREFVEHKAKQATTKGMSGLEDRIDALKNKFGILLSAARATIISPFRAVVSQYSSVTSFLSKTWTKILWPFKAAISAYQSVTSWAYATTTSLISWLFYNWDLIFFGLHCLATGLNACKIKAKCKITRYFCAIHTQFLNVLCRLIIGFAIYMAPTFGKAQKSVGHEGECISYAEYDQGFVEALDFDNSLPGKNHQFILKIFFPLGIWCLHNTGGEIFKQWAIIAFCVRILAVCGLLNASALGHTGMQLKQSTGSNEKIRRDAEKVPILKSENKELKEQLQKEMGKNRHYNIQFQATPSTPQAQKQIRDLKAENSSLLAQLKAATRSDAQMAPLPTNHPDQHQSKMERDNTQLRSTIAERNTTIDVRDATVVRLNGKLKQLEEAIEDTIQLKDQVLGDMFDKYRGEIQESKAEVGRLNGGIRERDQAVIDTDHKISQLQLSNEAKDNHISELQRAILTKDEHTNAMYTEGTQLLYERDQMRTFLAQAHSEAYHMNAPMSGHIFPQPSINQNVLGYPFVTAPDTGRQVFVDEHSMGRTEFNNNFTVPPSIHGQIPGSVISTGQDVFNGNVVALTDTGRQVLSSELSMGQGAIYDNSAAPANTWSQVPSSDLWTNQNAFNNSTAPSYTSQQVHGPEPSFIIQNTLNSDVIAATNTSDHNSQIPGPSIGHGTFAKDTISLPGANSQLSGHYPNPVALNNDFTAPPSTGGQFSDPRPLIGQNQNQNAPDTGAAISVILGHIGPNRRSSGFNTKTFGSRSTISKRVVHKSFVEKAAVTEDSDSEYSDSDDDTPALFAINYDALFKDENFDDQGEDAEVVLALRQIFLDFPTDKPKAEVWNKLRAVDGWVKIIPLMLELYRKQPNFDAANSNYKVLSDFLSARVEAFGSV